MADEKQRSCGDCGHTKGNHALPRIEGGRGGINGSCGVFSCGCQSYVPSASFVSQEYSGDKMPKWVAEDVKVKVKRTDMTKRYGLRVHGGDRGNDRAHPGDVGTIYRSDGEGWWSWQVMFSGGRQMSLDTDALESLLRVKG